MGRADKRNSPKMKRIKSRNKKKARIRARMEAGKGA